MGRALKVSYSSKTMEELLKYGQFIFLPSGIADKYLNFQFSELYVLNTDGLVQ